MKHGILNEEEKVERQMRELETAKERLAKQIDEIRQEMDLS